MTTISLVLTDIDGTLLTPEHKITQDTKQIVNQLMQKEISVILASARPPAAIYPLVTELNLHFPIVSLNGALICDYQAGKCQKLFSLPLERLDALLVYQLITTNFKQVSVNIYSEDRWLVDEEDDWVKQEMDITGVEAETIDLKEFLKEYHPVHKILCMGSPQEIEELENTLDQSSILNINYQRSKDTYLEIVNSQVSKLAALYELTRYYQITVANTLAIGDNFNDLPMIKHAGIGIAMGNSPLAVKQQADYVTQDNAHNGFYLALANCLNLSIIN